MKIAFCNNNLTGLYLFRKDVARHFAEAGHEVILLFPHAGSPEDDERIRQLSVFARCIPIPIHPNSQSVGDDITLYRVLKRIYRDERPDIVFNYTIKPNIYSALAARRQHIRVVDMMAGLGYVFQGNSLKKRFLRWLYRRGLKAADRVIVLNQANYETVADRFVDRQRLMLFPGGEGVSLEEYPFQENHFASTTFLMVSRLLYDKGYQEFVDAARIVRKQYPEVRFQLLGDLSEDSPTGVPKSVLDRDVSSGAIEYLGVTSDVPSVVRQDGVVVVVPSYYMEGMNRALMEACAMGRPIITTDMPGCGEMVDDGLTGYCVPSRDARSLADACMRFLSLSEEEKRHMARASHDKCRSQFDLQIVIADYERIMRQLCP